VELPLFFPFRLALPVAGAVAAAVAELELLFFIGIS
jgi:hypothetical protein